MYNQKLDDVNAYMDQVATIIASGEAKPSKGPFKVGVDLGTANIVLIVFDEQNKPVAGASYPASVVKDGLVVDYVGAVRIVTALKKQVENLLQVRLTHAATAVPPGTVGGNAKAISNVIESASFEVTQILDEPTAAATVLGVQDGAVVDVGGGTTGISILKDGVVIFTDDEATGGTHMSLVLSGYYKIPFDEAEVLKKDTSKESEVFTIVKPVVEKMSSIVKKSVQGYPVEHLYIVGGASSFQGFEEVFEKEIGIKSWKPLHPLLITPVGIAMNSVAR